MNFLGKMALEEQSEQPSVLRQSGCAFQNNDIWLFLWIMKNAYKELWKKSVPPKQMPLYS